MPAEPNVTLRHLRASDWRAVHAWTRDERICRYQPWDPKTEEETREYVGNVVKDMAHRPQSRWVFAVEHAEEVVGSCELNLRAHQEAEIACVIRADRWGHGLATAATRRLLDLSLNHPGFDAHLLRWEGASHAEEVRPRDAGQGDPSGA